MKKNYARVLHLGIGTHSFGNATTILAKEPKSRLEIMEPGVLYINDEAKKKIFVPWANIKSMELAYGSDWNDYDTEFHPLEELPTKEVAQPIKSKRQ